MSAETKFKVGDRVRIISAGAYGGKEGVVTKVRYETVFAKLDGEHILSDEDGAGAWNPGNVELVELAAFRPAKGDRVRVVLEGEVTRTSAAYGGYYTIGGNTEIFEDDKAIVSIEKIEPPVVTFKPGDVVRSKSDGDVRTLSQRGWINHTYGSYHESSAKFTSENYELVSLG